MFLETRYKFAKGGVITKNLSSRKTCFFFALPFSFSLSLFLWSGGADYLVVNRFCNASVKYMNQLLLKTDSARPPRWQSTAPLRLAGLKFKFDSHSFAMSQRRELHQQVHFCL